MLVSLKPLSRNVTLRESKVWGLEKIVFQMFILGKTMLTLRAFSLIWIGIDYSEKGHMSAFNTKNGGVIFFYYQSNQGV